MIDDCTPITKEVFIGQNPFGTISKLNADGATILLTQEEYDEWVEFTRGVWDDAPESYDNIVEER